MKVSSISPNVLTAIMSVFSLDKRFDLNHNLEKYEKYLQQLCLLTASFSNVKKGNLNPQKRRIQMFLIITFLILGIRYVTFALFLLLDNKTRTRYQYLTLDYMETLGILGRTLNVIYAVALFPVNADKILFRQKESSAKIGFWTEMDILKSRRSSGGLNSQEKRKLSAFVHAYVHVCMFGHLTVGGVLVILQVTGCVVFLITVSESLTVSVLAVIYLLFICWAQTFSCGHILAMSMSMHITATYFWLRIKKLSSKLSRLKDNLSEKNLLLVLKYYDQLALDFDNFNSCLKYAMRNLFIGLSPLASVVFYIITVEMNAILKMVVISGASTFLVILLATEYVVGHMNNKIHTVYQELNKVCARNAAHSRKTITFYSLLRVKMIVREIGSTRKDGQYRIGLTNGKGAAFTTLDAVKMTLAILQYTLLFIINT